MKISFFNINPEANRLILIFPGWSCEKEMFGNIFLNGWEVAVVEEYGDSGNPGLSFRDIKELERFSTIYLFAWSLGVYFASLIDFNGKISAAFAINGTLLPSDDRYGIPKNIFLSTAENLSPRNIQKFRRRMAGDSENYRHYLLRDFSELETADLRHQLFYIINQEDSTPRNSLPWKKIYISEDDSIFPPENMFRFWHSELGDSNVAIEKLKGPHFVDLFRIIRHSVPDLSKVAQRFSDAETTYNNHAVAQKDMIAMLLSSISGIIPSGGKILEIGSGTGMLTKEIIERLHPSELDLVDISSVRPAIGDFFCKFYQADAEDWIADTNKIYDAILSSATVQWFVNLPAFLDNASARLSSGGILAFSTFLPGNLMELDTLRPSPLHYHSSKEIRTWLSRNYNDITVTEKEITLHFDSPSALFDHLRLTGVGGSAPSGKLSLSIIRNLKQLTFKCGIFTAKRKKYLSSTKNPSNKNYINEWK